MSCDVLPFEKWIKSGFDRVLSGKSEYEEVNGNVCCAENACWSAQEAWKPER